MAIQEIGVVGLGLLGRGIASTMTLRGFRAVAYSRSAQTRAEAFSHVRGALDEAVEHGWLLRGQVDDRLNNLRIVDQLDCMHECDVVIESVVEDLDIKGRIFDELETILDPAAVIATNTSALPITRLQQGRAHPERFIGMHWGEPCHVSRFLEIIRGELTNDQTVQAVLDLGYACGKEPSLVQKDVIGFITNRLMYAMLREAFHLLETGVGDVETIDRSFRNDIGFWATIAGPFRWMDLTGIPAYARVMKDLLPQLACTSEIPASMRAMIEQGAEGVGNQQGFYPYDEQTAKQWMKTWAEFTWQIRKLADKYVPAQPRDCAAAITAAAK